MREDFENPDLYAMYVRENIHVGMPVRCCRAYEDVKLDDVGIVREVSCSCTSWNVIGAMQSYDILIIINTMQSS